MSIKQGRVKAKSILRDSGNVKIMITTEVVYFLKGRIYYDEFT